MAAGIEALARRGGRTAFLSRGNRSVFLHVSQLGPCGGLRLTNIGSRTQNMKEFRAILFRFYDRVQPLVAPGLRNAQFAYRDTLKSLLSPTVRWLDLGCGRRLFPEWMPGADELQTAMLAGVKSAFGLDPDFPSLRDNRFLRARVQGCSHELPFADNSFDLLTANMVIEHVAEPGALLSEARRVLAPGGLFLFHTPNLRSYATFLARLVPGQFKVGLVGFFEGRKEEDVFPTLYRMNTAARVTQYATQHGFLVQSLQHAESSAQAVILGPFVILELLWIRLLRFSFLAGLRSNLIVILKKPEQPVGVEITYTNYWRDNN